MIIYSTQEGASLFSLLSIKGSIPPTRGLEFIKPYFEARNVPDAQQRRRLLEAVLDRGLRDAYATIRGLADDLDQHIAARATNFFQLTTSAHRSRNTGSGISSQVRTAR